MENRTVYVVIYKSTENIHDKVFVIYSWFLILNKWNESLSKFCSFSGAHRNINFHKNPQSGNNNLHLL